MSWYRPDIILKYAKLLTVRRDDESFDLMDSKIKEIEETYNTTIGIIDMKAMDISSGFIRTHSREEIKKLFQNQYINILSIMICILILTLTEPGPLTK